MKTILRSCLFCLLLLGLALPQALAANAPATPAAPQKPVPDKPEPARDRMTVVSVQADGTDSLGARLTTRLKERFNQSNLFSLTDEQGKDGARMVILLSTAEEFPSRKGLGSVYAVCWTFSQGNDYLNLLLGREVGTVGNDNLDALVDKLVERTDGIAAKYGKLWK